MRLKWKTPIEFKMDESTVFDIGNSKITVQRKTGRWQIEHENIKLSQLIKKDAPKNIYASEKAVIHIVPALPPLPVVLKSNDKIYLMPREKMNLFVPVPVWVQFYGPKVKQEGLMCEFASDHLSDTWFGEPQSGEKAYSIHFNDSFFENRTLNQLTIQCPVEIHNNSDEKLEFHRFALRVFHLSVFQTEDGFKSNKTKIVYTGEEQISDIHYDKKQIPKNQQLINPPRTEAGSKFLGRSFSFSTKPAIFS